MKTNNKILRWAVLPLSLALSACGGGGGGGTSGGTAQATAGNTTPDTPAVSWYSTAKPLIERYCVACHTDGVVRYSGK